jgi:arsenite methyltransferase
MTGVRQTSAGHARSEASWLDLHFQAARAEYEDSLRHVGVQPDWTVLDAGCGGGSFVPLMCELVGSRGTVVALDLAPENIAHVEALARDGSCPANLQTRVGSVLSLPFDNATFDCVWSANVMQYLTETEFDRAVAECKRVLKPGAILAIKDFDATIMQFVPMDPAMCSRFNAARHAKSAETGVLGATCGTSIPSRLRRAGLTDIRRKGWLVERWAPVAPYTRRLVEDALTYFAGLAPQYDVPAADLQLWRRAAASPGSLIDDPDFCFREFFVLAVGRVAA